MDIVLEHTGAFYKDLSRLSAADRQAHDAAFAGGSVQYGYADFRKETTAGIDHYRLIERWVRGIYFAKGRCGGDDLSAFDELVAERLVAVVMGIEQCVDMLRCRHRAAHVREHPSSEFQVEKRIDEKRLVTVDDEPGVAPWR